MGYLAYVCKDCLVIHPLPMYLTSQGLAQKRHECSPQRLQDVHLILDKEKEISQLYANLPEVMKKVVNLWTNNQTYVYAAEVQREEISNNNVVGLDINTTTDKNNSWAARAIKDMQTMLTDEDLTDFLRRCNYNTLSYFKIRLLFQDQALPLYYRIGIFNQSMLKFITTNNKSNYQVSNHISSIPKPETEMTLEESFLSTNPAY